MISTSVLGRITPGTWQPGQTGGVDQFRTFTATSSAQLALTSSGGTPVRTFLAIPGAIVLGRWQPGNIRPDLAPASASGNGAFVGTAEPESAFTPSIFNDGAFIATAQPLASFGTGGAFVGTADPAASFTGVAASVAIGTANPQLSFLPLGGTNETCLTGPGLPASLGAPNYVY